MKTHRTNGECISSASFRKINRLEIRARRLNACATVEQVAETAGLEPDEWRRIERSTTVQRVAPEVAEKIRAALHSAELMAPTTIKDAPVIPPERGPRATCSAITTKGEQCRNWPQDGSTLCSQHAGGKRGAKSSALEQRVAQLEELLADATKHQLESDAGVELLIDGLRGYEPPLVRINALEAKVSRIESAIETISSAVDAQIKTPKMSIVERALGLAETDGTDVLEALADLLRVVKDREGEHDG